MESILGSVWAVIPVKRFGQAKQRLSALLTARERQSLARGMFEDVLDRITAVSGLAGVVVVTCDPAAAEAARKAGALVLDEPEGAGQSAAVRHAAEFLAGRPGAVLLTVPGDVPMVTPADIEAMIASHGEGRCLTLVPARDRFGTNALMLSPPLAMPFRFGADSFRRHRETAHRAGLAVRILERRNLELDIDTPADLRALLARPAVGRTAAVLSSISLADRRARQSSVAPLMEGAP